MIKEIRKIAKTNMSKAKYIRSLIDRNLIARHISERGYVCYDTEEYKNYRKTARIGRPIKIKGGENE